MMMVVMMMVTEWSMIMANTGNNKNACKVVVHEVTDGSSSWLLVIDQLITNN